jgi:hypothetical protein
MNIAKKKDFDVDDVWNLELEHPKSNTIKK